MTRDIGPSDPLPGFNLGIFCNLLGTLHLTIPPTRLRGDIWVIKIGRFGIPYPHALATSDAASFVWGGSIPPKKYDIICYGKQNRIDSMADALGLYRSIYLEVSKVVWDTHRIGSKRVCARVQSN